MKSVTLDKLQRPLKDLRISVTDRCNFSLPILYARRNIWS